MTTSPEQTLPEHPDERSDGPMTGTPHEVLTHWLDLYRATIMIKIGGLNANQLCERAAAPSSMSLIGVVRHLREVEAYWIREVLEGDEVEDYYCTEESRDGDFDDVSPETAFEDAAAYEREVAEMRAILGSWTDLTAVARGQRRGKDVNLGWILTHLVEEYARHLGHMDLLRERVDGRTGY
jgi:uncharacterized damage-inducible protein DinB